MAEVSRSRATKSQSWWTTVPGILTGLAALITAVGGLMIAYHQLNNRNEAQETASRTQTASNTSSSSAAPVLGAANGVATEIALPAISEVKLDAGAAVIRILKVELQPYNAEMRELKFTIRLTNNGRFPGNFFSDSYRLIVDDVRQAPTNLVSEVVQKDTDMTRDVIFEIPLTVTQVVLQISGGDGKTQIPVPLTPAVH